jgi:hypothetical protein
MEGGRFATSVLVSVELIRPENSEHRRKIESIDRSDQRNKGVVSLQLEAVFSFALPLLGLHITYIWC